MLFRSIAAGNNAEESSMVVLALALAQDPKVRLYNAGTTFQPKNFENKLKCY